MMANSSMQDVTGDIEKHVELHPVVYLLLYSSSDLHILVCICCFAAIALIYSLGGC